MATNMYLPTFFIFYFFDGTLFPSSDDIDKYFQTKHEITIDWVARTQKFLGVRGTLVYQAAASDHNLWAFIWITQYIQWAGARARLRPGTFNKIESIEEKKERKCIQFGVRW